MSMQDDLKTVFDSVVKKDDEAASAAFTAYLDQKAIEVMKKMNESKSPIQLKGNDVYVNGKKTGTVKHDAEENKDIQYEAVEGAKHKFKKLADLYVHLGKEHKLSEAVESEKKEEKDVKAMPNRPKFDKLKAYKSANKPGMDADGDHDGEEDGKQADAKRDKTEKKLIAKVDKKDKE